MVMLSQGHRLQRHHLDERLTINCTCYRSVSVLHPTVGALFHKTPVLPNAERIHAGPVLVSANGLWLSTWNLSALAGFGASGLLGRAVMVVRLPSH